MITFKQFFEADEPKRKSQPDNDQQRKASTKQKVDDLGDDLFNKKDGPLSRPASPKEQPDTGGANPEDVRKLRTASDSLSRPNCTCNTEHHVY